MRLTVTVLVLALAGCRGVHSAPASAGMVNARADTVDVLEAVWRVPAHPSTGAGVRWFYLPDEDSTGFTTSTMVREALARRGVPASARLPAGHDTVVYRVRRWTNDSAGVPVIELASSWTRVSASDPSICLSAGNDETFRVHRTPAGWEAERGRGIHGNGYCESNERKP